MRKNPFIFVVSLVFPTTMLVAAEAPPTGDIRGKEAIAACQYVMAQESSLGIPCDDSFMQS